jgi:atypical dual specificity phosphatase
MFTLATSNNGDNSNVSPHPTTFKAPYRQHDDGSSSSNNMMGSLSAIFPQIALGLALKSALALTVVLYVLNQSHLLPKPLAAVVSKVLFYPTLPITASKRIGKWISRIDDTVVMGGAPLTMFFNYPQKLKDEYGVKGVINMCEEWKGPTKQYKKLGIEELYLPTIDHFEPSQEDMISAISFIKRHEAQGNKVYVHCRAGHGRSGAVVLAWMMHKNYPTSTDSEKLNAELRLIRKVRKGLWKQTNVSAIHDRIIRNKGSLVNVNDDFFQEEKSEKPSSKKEL